ncbi:MAG: dienelactone hydrolase family protein [Chloroflexi bacterium]|nr:dienelactone hydrolase family protein [Chloroflexota bacterium]
MSNPQPDGYLALPANGSGRPVLVLHAWWGLNDTLKAFCDRLADAGFIAFAPDLYQGRITDTIDGADALAGELFGRVDEARAAVEQAATFLVERADGSGGGLGVVGFSLGAFFALDLSAAVPDQVHSVVVYYGTRPGDYSAAQAAYLGHYAENDPFEARADVDALEDALRQAGRPVTFHHYAGTGHWFAEPDRVDAYNRQAADLAWDRTLAFLRR